MITLRCTRKMLKRLGGPDEEPLEPSTNTLGDWYVNRVSLPGRTSVVLFANAESLLSVLVPGRGGKTTVQQFRERAARLFRRLDLHEEWIQAELVEMEDAQLAKTASRSVLALMNEIARHLTLAAEKRDGINPWFLDEQELILSEFLHGPQPYRVPIQEVRSLIEDKWDGRS